MMTQKTQKYVLANHFIGEPNHDDVTYVEEDLPDLKNGGA